MSTAPDDGVEVARIAVDSAADLQAGASAMRNTLAEVGVAIPASSRVWQYLRQLAALADVAAGKAPSSGLDLALLHQAIVELNELVLIVQELSRLPAVPRWPELARQFLADAAMPTAGQGNTPARDLQFQLWLTAVFRKAGYHVEVAEPDVVLSDAAGIMGVAAKRVKSIKSLGKRLKEASRQLANSGCPGVIALDFSMLFDPDHATMVVADTEHITTIVRDSGRKFVERNRGHMARLVDHRSVTGIAVVTRGLFLVQGWRIASAMHIEWTNLCDPSDARYPPFLGLVKRSASAV